MNKKQKLNCIHFIYDSIYTDYIKALRKKKSDSLYIMRKKMYETYLKQFQYILNKDLKMNIDFVPLKDDEFIEELWQN